MISPQEIQYFLECARAGNLSRAAERLGVTQPALTMALRRLEHSAGAELFHRSKKGVRLTKAGELFQQEAKALADQWARLKESLLRSEEGLTGTYSIGCHPSVAMYALPTTLPALLADFPELRLDLQHDLSRKITERVIRGEIDLGIVVNPVRHADLVIRPLRKDQVGFYTGKTATATNRVGTDPGPVLLCEPDLIQTQTILRKTSVQFSRMVRTSSLELIASLTEAGAGIGILPGQVAAQWPGLKPLPDLPRFQDEIALLYRAENRRVAAFRELAQRLEKGML
jgi:LysR family transcriptional regulator, cell division regulator